MGIPLNYVESKKIDIGRARTFTQPKQYWLGIAIILDISKAFDKCDLNFLLKTMKV